MFFYKFKILNLIMFIIKVIKILINKLERFIKIKNLKNYPDKIYNISVDDVNFRMSFGNQKIGETILQRINGVREIDTTAIIKSILRPGNKVLHLGSSYGYFAMLMSDSVGPSGKVICIEGLPNYFKILESNISKNSFKNINCFNYFIGSKSDTIAFGLDDTSPYKSIDEYQSGLDIKNVEKKILVKVINIADFINEIAFVPSHIFMDIEGFEVDALEQLSKHFLKNYSPTIIFEFHEYLYNNDKGLKYLRKLLASNNYITRKIGSNIIAFK